MSIIKSILYGDSTIIATSKIWENIFIFNIISKITTNASESEETQFDCRTDDGSTRSPDGR